MTDPIFKIMTAAEWNETQERGTFAGSRVDLEDGFIHFSSASQVRETARRHFAGRENLVLLWVDQNSIAGGLKWEPSRGGVLFPHLYGDLPVIAVTRCDPLPLSAGGGHEFPADLPGEDLEP